MLRYAIWLCFLCWLSVPNCAVAQSKSAQKKIQQLLQQGYQRLDAGETIQAIGLLREVLLLDSNQVQAHLGLAQAESQRKQHAKAVYHFQRARSLDPKAVSFVLPIYAEELAGIGEFQIALSLIDSLLRSTYSTSPNETSYLEKKRARYLFAVNYDPIRLDTGYRFEPKNLGPRVNSPDPEYLPTLTIDGQQLYFTRNRNARNEDFFVTERDSSSNWQSAHAVSGEVNTPWNEGAMHISQDGEWMVFTACSRTDGYGGCDLYISYRTPTGWTPGQNLGGRINTDQWESQPCLSPDKKSLYFVSRRPGGYGGSDLYVSHLLRNGKWDSPVNLGPNINTPGDEQCPFLHADNQTLYFTSPYWTGYGNDDLFLAHKQPDGSWSKPENLGYPINTIDREGSLIIAADGITAYYASNRSDALGDMDLYQFELPKHARPTPTYWIRGKVTDQQSGKPIPAQLNLLDASTGNSMTTIQADEAGLYLVTLPAGKNYLLTIRQPGYFFHSESFSMQASTEAVPQQLDVQLRPFTTNTSVILQHIYFQTNRSDLADSSRAELITLSELLKENPNLIVEIGGHTDNVGAAADNLSLSKRRAESVVQFLLRQGIPKSRLQAKGYGSSEPIAENNTTEGRAKNRRSEMKILQH